MNKDKFKSLLFYRKESSGAIYCNHKNLFVTRKECNSYDRYGQHNASQLDHKKNCGCKKVTMLPYHDGRNNRTCILNGVDYTKVSSIESRLYRRVLKNMEWIQKTTGIQHFSSTVNGINYHICQSCWQGDFELYSITISEWS